VTLRVWRETWSFDYKPATPEHDEWSLDSLSVEMTTAYYYGGTVVSVILEDSVTFTPHGEFGYAENVRGSLIRCSKVKCGLLTVQVWVAVGSFGRICIGMDIHNCGVFDLNGSRMITKDSIPEELHTRLHDTVLCGSKGLSEELLTEGSHNQSGQEVSKGEKCRRIYHMELLCTSKVGLKKKRDTIGLMTNEKSL
jgi:hypothetical protein